MAEQRELPGFEVTRPEFDLLKCRSSLVRSSFIVDGAGGVRSGTKNE